jgi:hypothetical protein
VPWRQTVGRLLESVRTWAREHYGAVLDAHARARFGDPPAPDRPADLVRAHDDCICAAGSAGEGASILSVFADQAGDLPAQERDQLRRWERERHRGVYVAERCERDQVRLWDPLEGAPLTLHLLDKLGASEVDRVRPGTVVTATRLPWMARLVAVGDLEFYADPRALALFREQTLQAGARWHEPPAPAPAPSRDRAPSTR